MLGGVEGSQGARGDNKRGAPSELGVAPRLIEFLKIPEKKAEEAGKVLGGIRVYAYDARTLVLKREDGKEVMIRAEGLGDRYTLLGAFYKLFGDAEKADKASELVALFIDLDAVEERLLAPRGGRGPAEGEGRGLGDAKLIELKELLREPYAQGYGQDITVYLSWWLARAGVAPASAVRLVKMLHEESGDPGLLKLRLAAVVHGYRRAGWDLEKHAREVEAEAGVGLKELEEVPVNAGEWAGVYEILEKAVGAERARYIVLKVEEILGASSPFKDPVFEVLDYTRQIYAVADLKELVVVRAKRWQDTIRYMEKVAIGAPTAIEVYVNPLGGISKFKVRWEAPTLTRPLEIGPAPLEDIVKRLAAEGLVIRERLVKDVAAAVVNGFVRSGRAVIKVEAEAPGFYLVNDRVEALRLDVPRPDPRELREALELLNELAGNWFGHARDKFSAVVKWGVMSPFSYIYKQKGKWMPWLYLHGSSHTGKTTLGDIVLSIWGLDSRYRKSGSNIDTPARIGYILSQGTFPVLVNEPGGAISKEDIIEIIKNAVEGLVVRGRYERGSYTEVPALAPLVITSNKVLPKDDALLRRFLVLRFTYGEKIDPAKAGEFEEKVKPRLSKLSALGRYITSVVLGEPGVLDRGWEEAAEALLEKAYREAGLEPPGWIYERPQAEDNIYEDMRESIRNFLVERINDAYFKAAGRVEVLKEEGISFGSRLELGFEERARVVLTAGLIPWMVLRRGEDGEELVMFFSGFARELEEVVGDIGGLKSIAELLGWGYKNVKLGGEVKRAAVVKLRDLIDFLAQ